MEEWRRVTTFWPPDQLPPLLTPLRSHARSGDEFRIFVGPGWFDLVHECHVAASSAFPGYELLAVKQKYARLAFQAGPRPWVGRDSWPTEELSALDALIEPLEERSEEICERCGGRGCERDTRPILLTLCDSCEDAVPPA